MPISSTFSIHLCIHATTSATDSLEVAIIILDIYYQSCLGCGFTGMQVKFSSEILYTLSFKALWTANGSGYKLFETNLLIAEDVAFISSKSGVDTWQDNKVMSAVRTERQTDTFSALYSRYTVLYADVKTYVGSLIWDAGSIVRSAVMEMGNQMVVNPLVSNLHIRVYPFQ